MLGSPTLANMLRARLRLPVIGAPMFIASTPELVIAQCAAGIIGAIPALNLRSTAALNDALDTIAAACAAMPGDVPYCVNLVAHRTNARLEDDLAVIVAHRVPLVIVSLAAPAGIVSAIHAYGGLVFNDVISEYHARKCADAGVDGLIAVCAGAGGHTGKISPFALVQEIRDWWEGPLVLAGCVATGRAIVAAEAIGADLVSIGSPFLAAAEANTADAFRRMVVECRSQDVVVADCFTGVPATFLRPSIVAAGLDPAKLTRAEGAGVNIADGGSDIRAWRDIWSAGQGIGAVRRSGPAAVYIAQLADEYSCARASMAAAYA